jgi:CBS domain-containing protein
MDLARNLKIDSVSRLGPPPPLTLPPSASVAQAVTLMRQHGTGCVLVGEAGRLLGIFTERDLLNRVLGPERPLTTPLADCMTPSPVTVQAKEPAGVALRKMQEGGYRHLPVVTSTGTPTGILSVKNIIKYLVEHFPQTVLNQPPDPDVVQSQREGA